MPTAENTGESIDEDVEGSVSSWEPAGTISNSLMLEEVVVVEVEAPVICHDADHILWHKVDDRLSG